MVLLNIKTFIKHLLKNKLYTLITVLGFAMALTFVMLLSVYLMNELSVNSTQINKERIYRLTNEKFSNTAPPIGAWLQSEFPEIESFTRAYSRNAIVHVSDDRKIQFDYLLADSTFFNIFNVPLIEGNIETALKTKNSAVLDKEYAHKLFGKESPLGKELKLSGGVSLVITGVYENLQEFTHFKKVDAIVNFRLLADIWNSPTLMKSKGNCSFDLYLLGKENTNLANKTPEILKLFKDDFWIYRDDRVKEVILEPLSEVYFSKIGGSGIKQNSKALISILLAVVILILLLSIINYINLTIAQSGMRAKEMAIRKLVGSSRVKLLTQYVVESVVLILVAFIISIFLAFFAENIFNNLLDTQLKLSKSFSIEIITLSFLFISVIGFISGIIPAIIITKTKAIDVLKGGFRKKSKAVYSRSLIGFQYVVVIVLLISTIVISKQSAFLMNKDLGFSSKNIIQLPFLIERNQKESLKNEFLKVPGITNVSFVSGTPIDGGNNNSFTYNDKPVSFQIFKVDSSFLNMTEIKIQPTGVAYSKDGIWINRTAVNGLELDLLPKSFKKGDEEYPVLGVVEDFHFRSLHQEVGMLMIFQIQEDDYPWNVLIEIDGKNIAETTRKMKETYSNFTHGLPFDFEYFDDRLISWYEKEKRTSNIISYFAILSIIISVMGIFAMSIFYNQQKIKEIGIRKVNGATEFEIIKMLNKDFIKWVLIAFVIAVPIAYYVLNKWLQGFAYKIDLSWWIFAAAGFLALIIALITVSSQTFWAARRNPIESLKYE